MVIGIEKERPSKLEELLDSFKQPVNGHIEISPRAARSILLERLLAYYRKNVVGSPNVDVEVLAQVAGDGDKLVDYTETRKKFVDEAERAQGRRRKKIWRRRVKRYTPYPSGSGNLAFNSTQKDFV